ncbi:MAG TPA: GNAT family N-acetyltransferase [Longimicrobium sp.]|nr:GNAT family N-acetyltransferase [Longimicrobium sp.]
MTEFLPASSGDEERILPMIAEFYECEGIDFHEDRARRALATLLADASLGRVWWIEEGGAPAGYMVMTIGFSLEFAGRFALIDELYLRPAHRGSGAGTRAVETAAAACRAMGVAAIRLEVSHDNPSARRLYDRLGFRAHERDLMTRWLDGNG